MALTPHTLPANGTIGIIAPSSRGVADAAGIALLEARGFRVSVHAQNGLTLNQSAGSAQARAKAIGDVFADTGIDAVMAARGGNRVMHALPFIDFDAIKANPKPFIGFSDSTALLNAIYARTGLITYHGPTLSRLGRAGPEEMDQMVACLQGRAPALEWAQSRTLKGGRARGRLVGGNLSMMAALCGTPYMPDMDGAILFLEDAGDELSRYDRLLAQLRLSVFGGLAGIVFGNMAEAADTSVTPFGFTLADIIAEHVAGLDIPVLVDAPFGHKGPLYTLPVGGMAVLDADKKTLTPE